MRNQTSSNQKLIFGKAIGKKANEQRELILSGEIDGKASTGKLSNTEHAKKRKKELSKQQNSIKKQF